MRHNNTQLVGNYYTQVPTQSKAGVQYFKLIPAHKANRTRHSIPTQLSALLYEQTLGRLAKFLK